jgi:hypothetical protein
MLNAGVGWGGGGWRKNIACGNKEMKLLVSVAISEINIFYNKSQQDALFLKFIL